MIKLPILSMDGGGSMMVPETSLPVFYMEDYSVMGLRVTDLDSALELLAGQDMRLSGEGACRRVVLDDRRQIPRVVDLLTSHGISCIMADVAEQMYQG